MLVKSVPTSVVPRVSKQCWLTKSVLIELVLSKVGSTSLQISNVLGNLIDGLDLLCQVLGLNEVTHLSIAMAICDLVEIEQSLVHVLLQFQRRVHGLHTSSPVSLLGRLEYHRYGEQLGRLHSG